MPRPSVEAERREQILAAACEVIAERGIRELRVADVARTAAVSSGTVHYYFETKRALLNGALAYNLQRSVDRRRDLLDAGDGALARLVSLVESYLPQSDDTVQAWRVWAELWVEGIREPDLQQVNEGLYAQWRELIVEMIRRAQEEGAARAGDPVLLANMLIGMVDGLSMQVLLGSAAMDLGTTRATLRAFVDDMLAS
jgi:AcrR family transcriptional regulator